ncbi:9157_t:CDS:2 [Entrophospora sp. SA101]|nr:9157_t:CDS:2 [Entrophospora sp. SA101]
MLNVTAQHNNIGMERRDGPFSTQPGQSTTISRLPTNNLSIGTPLATTTS